MSAHREKRSFVFGLCVAVTFGIVFSYTVFGQRFNNLILDRVMSTDSAGTAVVVGIDDESLKALGAWPFNRSVFAQAITNLYARGAELVVFDVLFLEPREGDSEMRSAVTTTGSTVLFASKLNSDGNVIPHVYESTQGSGSALANVYPDEDGKVRRTYFFDRSSEGKCLPTLSYQAYRHYSKQDKSLDGPCLYSPLRFVYQEKLPQTLSLLSVVNSTSTEKDLRGKVVFVGSVSLDLNDHFVSNKGDKIAGVYIHAAMFQSMVSQSFPVQASGIVVIIVLACLTAYALYISSRKMQAIYQYFLLSAGAVALIVVGFLAATFGYILPIAMFVFVYFAASLYSLMFRYGITEKKNKQVRNLFSKYVHPDVLHELLAKPDIVLGGEKRYMSVLFSDLRGFTTFSETLSATELTELLNGYFSAMTPEILEEKGTIDKFIGDAIMAFWNAPLFVENHEYHAVSSALRMQQKLSDFNRDHGTCLAIGIGIHAGDVVVGNVGGKDRVNYTVLGDVVNLASRIEGLTKKYGVMCIVTEEVKVKVADPRIMFRKLDVIVVKGKTVSTVLYEVRYSDVGSKKLFEIYEEAFGLYSVKSFEQAKVLFESAVQQGDIPSQKMLERIAIIEASGEDFDGVWRFDEK